MPTQADILVIGSTNIDMITQTDHLPAVGETVVGGTFVQTFGGKGANQAVAAARASSAPGRVGFLSCIGEDAHAASLLANFQAHGVAGEHVIRKAGASTGIALIMFDTQGRNYITVASGANHLFAPADVEGAADAIAAARMIILQNEIAPAAACRALEIAHAAQVPVMLNYAPASNPQIPLDRRIRYLVVNESEAAQLSALPVATLPQVHSAAARLREMGPEVVIVTLGAEGSYLLEGDLSQQIPPFPVQAVDSTAAGDTYCGALAVGLLEGMPLLAALRFATAASAISVTRMGAQPSIPSRVEIDAFLAQRS